MSSVDFKDNRPFPVTGHMTSTLSNWKPVSKWIPEMKRAPKDHQDGKGLSQNSY